MLCTTLFPASFSVSYLDMRFFKAKAATMNVGWQDWQVDEHRFL